MSRINPDSDQVLKFMGDGYQIHKETEDISIQIASFQLDDINYFATYFWPLKFDKPKALVFICHGYGEYFSETYDEVCKELASNGVLAFGHDHKGHGKTGGERVHVNSMDEYVRPMLLHIKKLSKDFNDQLPIFALGHSMGGLITTYAGIEGQDLFKGLIFMGPLIKMDPNIATPIKRQLAHWLQAITPKISLGYLEHEAITRDKNVVERVKEDKLIWHGGFRVRHSHVLLKATDDLQDGNLLKKIHVPVLIFQGNKDRLVLPEGAKFLNQSVSSTDKKLVTFEEAFHNLFVELEDVKVPVIKETVEWILKHI